MDVLSLFITALLAFLPISELRGAIPYALAKGFDWRFVYIYTVSLNALVAPVGWLFLATLHKQLIKITWYRSFFDHFVAKAQAKIQHQLEKWGWLGLALFIAIPLPITGAWTGTLGAWVLGLSRPKTLAATSLGVAAAGAIVTAVVVLGIRTLDIFVKQI